MGVIDTFIILILAVVSLIYRCVKTHQIADLKYVQVIICQLYLHKAVLKKKVPEATKMPFNRYMDKQTVVHT